MHRTQRAHLHTGAVAILDALGMSGVWQHENIRKRVKAWEDLCEKMTSFQEYTQGETMRKLGSTRNTNVVVRSLSDTIIVTAKGEDPADLLDPLAQHVAVGIVAGLKSGILLRGAISVGEFAEGRSISLGPAIDQAAEWHQKADWMWAMLTPNAALYLESKNESGALHPWNGRFSSYYKYCVPLKGGGKVESWSIDWPLSLGDFSEPVELDRAVARERDRKKLLNYLAKQYIGTAHESKYRNTLKYFDDCWDEYERRVPESGGQGGINGTVAG